MLCLFVVNFKAESNMKREKKGRRANDDNKNLREAQERKKKSKKNNLEVSKSRKAFRNLKFTLVEIILWIIEH